MPGKPVSSSENRSLLPSSLANWSALLPLWLVLLCWPVRLMMLDNSGGASTSSISP